MTFHVFVGFILDTTEYCKGGVPVMAVDIRCSMRVCVCVCVCVCLSLFVSLSLFHTPGSTPLGAEEYARKPTTGWLLDQEAVSVFFISQLSIFRTMVSSDEMVSSD
jgi:hypothetical protein